MRHTHRRDGRRRRAWQLPAALLAALAFTGAAATWSQQDADPAPRAGQREAASTKDPDADVRPTRLSIPQIKVSTSVGLLGLNEDRTVEVPSDPDQVGWYRFGSLPGRPGSAVILGHVDSTAGPAVFYRLRLLKLGATIDVERADGTHLQFEVDSIDTFANAKFPATKVYRIDGPPRLTLVTCTGDYDITRGGYQANLVVSATLIGLTRD